MKKIILALIILALALTAGCTTSAEHRRAHQKANEKNFTEIHKFVDRHVWNYDWDNPYHN